MCPVGALRAEAQGTCLSAQGFLCDNSDTEHISGAHIGLAPLGRLLLPGAAREELAPRGRRRELELSNVHMVFHRRGWWCPLGPHRLHFHVRPLASHCEAFQAVACNCSEIQNWYNAKALMIAQVLLTEHCPTTQAARVSFEGLAAAAPARSRAAEGPSGRAGQRPGSQGMAGACREELGPVAHIP